MIGVILILAVILARSYQARPIDDYRFHTPPPGPDARPDPPNPDKIKHRPGALKPSK